MTYKFWNDKAMASEKSGKVWFFPTLRLRRKLRNSGFPFDGKNVYKRNSETTSENVIGFIQYTSLISSYYPSFYLNRAYSGELKNLVEPYSNVFGFM